MSQPINERRIPVGLTPPPPAKPWGEPAAYSAWARTPKPEGKAAAVREPVKVAAVAKPPAFAGIRCPCGGNCVRRGDRVRCLHCGKRWEDAA